MGSAVVESSVGASSSIEVLSYQLVKLAVHSYVFSLNHSNILYC